MRVLKPPSAPRGVRRALFRLPIQLYRLRLGWILGGRFMLLTHIGRRSGRPRQTVIEVVDHDRATRSYLVCSGFGAKADWYRNVVREPRVTVQVGRHRMEARAQPLSAEEGGEAMARYAMRHRYAAKRLARFMGFEVDGTEADFRAVGLRLPWVRFSEVAQ